LDERLSSGEYFSRLGDVVLQEMLIEGVSNLQRDDKSEGGNFFPEVGDSAELMLKKIDVGLEAIPCVILTERRWLLLFLAS